MEKTLEERVAALEDKERINEVLNAYAFSVDEKDLEGLLSTFDENIHLNYVQQKVKFVGKADARKFFSAVIAANKVLRHKIINRNIEVSGDKAKVKAYFMATLETQDGGERELEGKYYGTLRKAGGDWKIAELKIDLTKQKGTQPEYRSVMDKT